MSLPSSAPGEWHERLVVARQAVESAGDALLRLPRAAKAEEIGDQLKTAADQAAEAWVVAYLKAYYPNDRFLAEEDFTAQGEWDAPPSYWTIDALDGTRSYVDGFAGFCVQVAFVAEGTVRLGVVHEPVLDQTYLATLGGGAYRHKRDEEPVRIGAHHWTASPRLIDSTRPSGPAGQWFARNSARFVELGSIGLKICRVADGSADLFLKRLKFRLWDVAPGGLILAEAGGRLGLWDGSTIPFGGPTVSFRDILATHSDRFDIVVRGLADIEAPSAGSARRMNAIC